MTPSQKSTLRRNAKKNALNPEHLMKIAMKREGPDAEILRQIAEENGWKIGAEEEDEIPFGMWIEICCQYIEGGPERMAELAISDDTCVDYFYFSLAVLQRVKTEESVLALVRIAEELPGVSLEGAEFRSGKMGPVGLLSEAINLVLSLKGAPEINNALESRVREFLHAQIGGGELELDTDLSITIYALRGVGDSSSIDLLGSVRELPDPWDDCVPSTKRAIKKRIAAKK